MNATTELETSIEEQLEATWMELAQRRFADGAVPQEAPAAVFVCGVPGFDVGPVMELLRQEFEADGDCVTIAPLELQLLHPLAGLRGRTAEQDQHLLGVAATLAADLLDAAIDARQHVLAHCPIETSDAARSLIEYLLDEQFNVQVIGCVSSLEGSWARCCEWFRGDIGRRLPRLTRATHDELHAAMCEALLDIEADRRVTEFVLVDHSGRCLLALPQADEWPDHAVARVLNSLSDCNELAAAAVTTEPPAVAQRREYLRLLARFAEMSTGRG